MHDVLKRLNQMGLVHEYMKEFSSLLLDIHNTSEDDKLFNFIIGLQNWAYAKLRRQSVRNQQSAIVAIDGLLDYKDYRDRNVIKSQ